MKKYVLMIAALIGCAAAYGQKSDTKVSTSGGVYGDTSGSPRGRTGATVTTRGTVSPWVFTGNIGFDFRDTYFHLSVAPQIGYSLTNFLIVGGGVSYDYYNNKNGFVRHTAGVNVYARAYLLEYITFHVQPEGYMQWRFADGKAVGSGTTGASILAGAGLTYPVASKGYVSAMVFYDILQRADSPYGNRIFYSVGYGFRF